MSELPPGWTEISFGTLNSFSSKALDPSDSPDETFELYSVPAFPTGKPELAKGMAIGSTKQAVNTGDILVCKINPRINRVWVVDEKTGTRQIASSEWIVMRATGHNPRFLCRYFSSPEFRELLCTDLTGVGGSLTRAQPKRVATYRIPIAPESEQRRIAVKLDALLARVDATRARLDRVPVLLKRFRQSVLAAATSGELTEEWRNKQEPQYKWTECSLGEVCESSFYGPRFGKDEYTDHADGIPTIRTTDMTDDGRISITADTPRVRVPKEKLERFQASRGDLLITRTGSIGVMAVFNGNYAAIPSAYLIRFRFKPVVLPRFAFFCLMAPTGQASMGMSATAITQPNINADSIKAIKVGLPTIEEQHEIVSRVESLFALADRLQTQYERAGSQVNKLTPSLLTKAFRGELVPQDPNDVPAQALQERLRTNTVTVTVATRKGRKAKAAV
ncbi:MAG: restriction endonuclease subunit S [Proteobacteria bacterium]|nr:restriction endonuclease subunit S [Pseudomonadota bacterium]